MKNKWLPLQQLFQDLHIDVQKSQMVALKFFCTKKNVLCWTFDGNENSFLMRADVYAPGCGSVF